MKISEPPECPEELWLDGDAGADTGWRLGWEAGFKAALQSITTEQLDLPGVS
jgi:hypothetical protein